MLHPFTSFTNEKGFSFIISSICMSVLCALFALLLAVFYYFPCCVAAAAASKYTLKKNNWTMNALRLGASRLAPSVFKTANGSLRRQVLGKCVIFKINVKSIWNQLLSLFGRTVFIVVTSSPIVCSSKVVRNRGAEIGSLESCDDVNTLHLLFYHQCIHKDYESRSFV